jgi:WD40 repeat protein/DNA-binding MarR family transcriptional regulator
MQSPRLWPALLIFILASGSILGFLAGAQEMHYQCALPNAGGDAAWSPDGTMLATSSGKNVSILNVADGSVLKRLVGHAFFVSSLSWSPDGTRLASGALDRTVRIWDVESESDLLNINLPDAIDSVAWSPDGSFIAASHGNVVTVWDVAASAKAADFEENATSIRSVAWSPDGTRLAAAGAPNFFVVYDMANLTRALRFTQLNSNVHSLAWSPDGGRLVTGSEKSVKIWNAWSGDLLKTLASVDNRLDHAVAWSPDGGRIAACLEIEPSRTPIWNSTTGKLVQTIFRYGTSLAFSPDGGQLAIGTGNTVYIYGFTGGLLQKTLTGHSDSVNSVSWSPDGRKLATASADTTVRIWNVSSGEELSTFSGHGEAVRSVRWSPDGTRIASADDGGGTIIWDPESNMELETLNGSYPVAWSPDGRFLATSGAVNGSVLLWDVAGGYIIKEIHTGSDEVGHITWSPDGQILATSSYGKKTGGMVCLWDVDTGTELRNISEKGRWAASPIAWSPDGKVLALSISNFDISIVDPGNLSVVNRVGFSSARTLAWCPDGKKIAYSLYDISIWNTSMPGPCLTFGEPGQGTTINAMAWSPLGALLATGVDNGNVMIWGPIGELPQLQISISTSAGKTWSGDTIGLTINVTDGLGAPVEAALVVLSSSEGELSPVTEAGKGTYDADFTSPDVNDNVSIIISASARKSGFVPAWATVAVLVQENQPPRILVMSVKDMKAVKSSVAARLSVMAMDPDGDPLSYEWREGSAILSGESDFLATFSPGNHEIVLAVSDGHSLTTQAMNLPFEPQTEPPAESPSVPVPVVAASVTVTVGLGIGLLLAAATEPGKYKLLSILFIPLYSRINKDAALDHETRGMIRGCIIADPGIHYSEIIRRLDLRNGTAAYHLQTLEREGIIKSRNDGRFRRFYPSEMRFIGSHIRPTKLQKIILETIQEKEGSSQIELAKTLDISYAIVHREIKRMALIGMIRLQRHGISMKCYLAEEWQERLRLEKAEASGAPVRDIDAVDG